jgi:hypothetical protein
LIFFGTVGAIIAGAIVPAIAIVMGEITDAFNPSNSTASVNKTMSDISLYVTLIGIGLWIFGYVYFAFW